MIAQRASVRVVLERDKDAENIRDKNTTKLYVTKNRPTGLEGSAGSLFFNLDTFTLESTDVGF